MRRIHIALATIVSTLTGIAGVNAIAAPAVAATDSAPIPYRFSGGGSETIPGFIHCDGFDIDLSTKGSFDGAVYFDQNGEVVKVIVHTHATDVLTNSVTGKTVTNRGVFEELFTRIDDTDDFLHSLAGYRFMANSPGEGVVIQDVGRILYSPDEEEILQLAGQHHVPDGPEAETVFCAALSSEVQP
jgi:hypothetical protein